MVVAACLRSLPCQHYRMVLAVMRVLCAVLLVFAAPFLATAETKSGPPMCSWSGGLALALVSFL